MSARGRQALKPLICLVVAVLAATAPAAAAAPAGRRPVVVRAAAPGAIELPSGERVELGLAAGAALAAVEPLAGGWVAAAVRPAGAGRRIALFAASEGQGGPVEIPAPPAAARNGRLQAEPLPLVEDGRLAGLVWLEGDEPRRFAVRAARWDGAAWTRPATVAAAGPGSQLALAAARLGDGSWLLAWSAFDGEDDEILWSRWDGRADGAVGRWSRPARAAADDGVPDITPALLPTAGGALLAWSRFDGEGYETVTARFSLASRRFAPPRTAASRGTVFPSLQAAPGGGAWMVARTAEPRGWSVTELDAGGAPLRRAAVAGAAAAGPASERPIAEEDARGVALRFPASGARLVAPWAALALTSPPAAPDRP